jgi:hypothetical protein
MRLALALIGLAIMLVSILILAYAVWPAGSMREQHRLAPTVFVIP